jgi:hypothetical protein
MPAASDASTSAPASQGSLDDIELLHVVPSRFEKADALGVNSSIGEHKSPGALMYAHFVLDSAKLEKAKLLPPLVVDSVKIARRDGSRSCTANKQFEYVSQSF